MNLLRYMSYDFGVQALMSGEFKLLRPLDANDPYEMMGTCKGSLRPEVEKEFLDDMRYKWIVEGMKHWVNMTPQSVEGIVQRVKNNKYFYKKIIMERQVQQKNLILSFADALKVDSIADQLMWGHYAGGGTGVRIWFDSNIFGEKLNMIFPVHYSSSRVCANLSELTSFCDVEFWKKYLLEVVFVKSKAWEYENELRLLIPSKYEGDLVFSRNDLEFVKLPLESIKRVDFGPKGIIENTKSTIRELKRNQNLRHVDFRIATFSEYDFSYVYLEASKLYYNISK